MIFYQNTIIITGTICSDKEDDRNTDRFGQGRLNKYFII